VTFQHALLKFIAAADWSREQFEAAVKTDPFWAEVVKHYQMEPERSVVAKDNALVRLLRARGGQ
jgi:hypothetical protein